MTTSARPFPFLPRSLRSFRPVSFASVHSFRLSIPVSRYLIFLPLASASLSFRFRSVLDTQLPVLPFSPPSVPPPSGFPNAPRLPFVRLRSSSSLPPGFPFGLSDSAYSAFLFVSVRSSLLRSHSRSTGASDSVRFYPSIFGFVLASVLSASTQLSLSFRFVSVCLGLCYLVSVSSVPFFELPPHSGFPSALPTSFPLSVLLCGSFSSFAPLLAVPFRFL